MEELKEEFKKLGIARIQVKFANPGEYVGEDLAYMKGLVDEYKSTPKEPKINPVRYFLYIILPMILTFMGTYYWKNKEITDLKKEIQSIKNQMPEIPVTVIDLATKNQLYIGRPIPRPTHYEFPITLNDGQGSYRIDQYRWFSDFKGVLIIQKGKLSSSGSNE